MIQQSDLDWLNANKFTLLRQTSEELSWIKGGADSGKDPYITVVFNITQNIWVATVVAQHTAEISTVGYYRTSAQGAFETLPQCAPDAYLRARKKLDHVIAACRVIGVDVNKITSN